MDMKQRIVDMIQLLKQLPVSQEENTPFSEHNKIPVNLAGYQQHGLQLANLNEIGIIGVFEEILYFFISTNKEITVNQVDTLMTQVAHSLCAHGMLPKTIYIINQTTALDPDLPILATYQQWRNHIFTRADSMKEAEQLLIHIKNFDGLDADRAYYDDNTKYILYDPKAHMMVIQSTKIMNNKEYLVGPGTYYASLGIIDSSTFDRVLGADGNLNKLAHLYGGRMIMGPEDDPIFEIIS
jgi:hypothetical protein